MFDPDTKYLLKVQPKVEDVATKSGNWTDGIHIEVYHSGKDYMYAGVTGKGSSGGWITVAVPFTT